MLADPPACCTSSCRAVTAFVLPVIKSHDGDSADGDQDATVVALYRPSWSRTGSIDATSLEKK